MPRIKQTELGQILMDFIFDEALVIYFEPNKNCKKLGDILAFICKYYNAKSSLISTWSNHNNVLLIKEPNCFMWTNNSDLAGIRRSSNITIIDSNNLERLDFSKTKKETYQYITQQELEKHFYYEI